MGIDNRDVPISADTTKELPFVKQGGAIAIPGIKSEFGDNVPEEMKPFWNGEVARTIHPLD